MNIRDLVLHTKNLEKQFGLYVEGLKFPLIEKWECAFCIRAGITHLTFQQSSEEKVVPYHFAFGLKNERVPAALEYLKNHVDIIKTEEYPDGIVDFPAWNAKSVYFLDADGNIVEFIARNSHPGDFCDTFSISDVKSVCEMGLPVENLKQTYLQLNRNFKLEKCQGETEDFCPIGDHDGMLIVVTSHKKNWFPTAIPAIGAHFEIVIQNQHITGELVSRKGQVDLYH